MTLAGTYAEKECEMTTKQGTFEVGGKKMRMAGDLLWFAAASLGAGLMAALAAAAIVMLLAQPAYSKDAERASAPLAAYELRLALLDESGHPLLLVFGREEDLDRLGLEREAGLEGGVHAAEHGFFRLLYRERRELGDLLRHVDSALLDLCVGDEVADEAHFVRVAGAEDVPGEDVAHRLVLADGAGEPLGAAASGDDADLHLGLAELRRLACNDDVAGHRELTAAAERGR